MIAFDEALRAEVAERLARFERIEAVAGDLRPAAVAFTIVGDEDGNAGYLLERRSAGLRKHASQWALPGGRMDDGETPAEAALREVREEVGLTLGSGAVLGLLDDYTTRSGFHITPVVVWGGATPALAPQEAEVESIHIVPLDQLELEPRFLEGPDPGRPVLQMPLYQSFIHAPTAAVMYQFRELCLRGRVTRVGHFDQPSFAWR